jgi:DNA-binding PadR family transcriptional regulator
MSLWGKSEEEIKESILRTMSELKSLGLIEVVGVDDEGNERFAITEAGKKRLDEERPWK